METGGLAPSPVARSLLDLAEQKATGTVEVGGRRVVLQEGRVVDVWAGTDDQGLGAFLVSAGRLSKEDLAAVEKAREQTGGELHRILVERKLINRRTMRDTRRALWLDRLVRGVTELERSPRAASAEFAPMAHDEDRDQGVALVPLVLDMLTRRAAVGDAVVVGQQRKHRLIWAQGPLVEEAKTWAKLVPKDAQSAPVTTTVGQILMGFPAAAPRLAALIRAGLLRLAHPDKATPPPPERKSVFPTLGDATGSRPAPALDPGRARPVLPSDLAATMNRLPPADAPLQDPLAPLERQLAQAEERRAPGHERALLFREIALVWQERFSSLEEAARAYREAVAADPEDTAALERAVALCDQLGRPDLALAYADALIARLSGTAKAEAYTQAARQALRAGRADRAVAILDRSGRADSGQPGDRRDTLQPFDVLETRTLLAELTTGYEKAKHTLAALRLSRADERYDPRHEPEWTARLLMGCLSAPSWPRLATEVTQHLARVGREAAAAGLAALTAEHAATRSLQGPDATDAAEDDRRSLRIMALENYQLAGALDRAFLTALRTFDGEPYFEELYDPLIALAEESRVPVHVPALLESFAAVCPEPSQGYWLTRAADAYLEAGDIAWGLELHIYALGADPGAPRPLEAIREQAERAGDPEWSVDALERACRLGLRRQSSPSDHLALGGLLLTLADTVGHSRALQGVWALDLIDSLNLKSLAEEVATRRARLGPIAADMDEAITASVHSAGPEGQSALSALDLARQMQHGPAHRDHARERLQRVLADGAADGRDEAEQLSYHLNWVEAEEHKVAAALRDLADRAVAIGEAEPLRALARWVALTREHQSSAQACRAWIEVEPGSVEATTRLIRAATRLNDDSLLRTGLTHLLQHIAGPEARGLLLEHLALCTLGAASGADDPRRVGDAVSLAVEALDADEHAVSAAFLILAARDKAPKHAVLRASKVIDEAAGPTAVTMRISFQQARNEGRAEDAKALLVRWADSHPLSVEPRVTLLHTLIAEEDPAALASHLAEALSVDGMDGAVVQKALRRLAELGEAETAALMTLEALDRLGARLPQAASWACQLDVPFESGDRVALLERWVAQSKGADRVAPLRTLAMHYAEEGDAVAESRTWLRLLAVLPKDDQALTRLFEIYAAAGDGERLMAVLNIRRDMVSSIEERRRILLDLAAAAIQYRDDLSRAEGFLRELGQTPVPPQSDFPSRSSYYAALGEVTQDLSEAAAGLVAIGKAEAAQQCLRKRLVEFPAEVSRPLWERAVAIAERYGDDPRSTFEICDAALHAIGAHGPVLVTYERLALSLGQHDEAEASYSRLVDDAMGPHGRRALLYRKARFLERCDRPEPALEAALEAFHLDPGAGVILAAITRLADRSQNFGALIDAHLALAGKQPSIDGRVEQRSKAAKLAAEKLGDERRAFEILFEGFKESGRPELFSELRQLVVRLDAQDPSVSKHCFDQLIDALKARAERMWEPTDKIGVLMQMAELHAVDRGDLTAATQLVEEVFEIGASEEVPTRVRADSLVTLAEWLEGSPGHRAEATKRVEQALALQPTNDRALALWRTLNESGSRVTPLPRPLATELAKNANPVVNETPHIPEPTSIAPPAPAFPLPAGTPGIPESSPLAELGGFGAHDTSGDSDEDDSGRVRRFTPAFGGPVPMPTDGTSQPVASPLARIVTTAHRATRPSRGVIESVTRNTETQGAVPRRDSTFRPPPLDPTPSSLPPLPSTPSRHSSRPPASSVMDQPGLSERGTNSWSSLPPSKATEPEHVREVLRSGNVDTMVEQGIAMLAEGSAREAMNLALTAARRAPGHVPALRLTHKAAQASDAAALVETTADWLSLFDTSFDATSPDALRTCFAYFDAEPSGLRDTRWLTWAPVFAMLWNEAKPLFRRSGEEYGLSEELLVKRGEYRPISEIFRHVAESLDDEDVQLYVRPTGTEELLIIPTQPPAIVVGSGAEVDQPLLRARLARATVLAQPAHILLNALPGPRGQRVVEAVCASFGNEGLSRRVSPEAADFGAQLWNTISKTSQRALADALAQEAVIPSFEELRQASAVSATRASLRVTGSPVMCAETLLLDDSALAEHDLNTERAFAEAANASRELRELIRYTLSDSYLAARAAATQGVEA